MSVPINKISFLTFAAICCIYALLTLLLFTFLAYNFLIKFLTKRKMYFLTIQILVKVAGRAISWNISTRKAILMTLYAAKIRVTLEISNGTLRETDVVILKISDITTLAGF